MDVTERFFLLCLRYFFRGKNAAEKCEGCLNAGTGVEINWDHFLALAQWHGVLPLVYHSMKEMGWSGIPEWVRRELVFNFRANMARNLFLSVEMEKVLEILGQKGIQCIILKGVYLSEEVYPDISYRTATDIDLLIQRDDMKRAEEALVKAGYSRDPFVRPGFSPDNCYTLHLEKGDTSGQKSCVELHWNLAMRRDYKIPIDRWWRKIYQNTRHDAQGKGIQSLWMGPEITLLYLTINAHMSRYSCLKQLVDIAQVIKYYGPEIDWEELIKMAGELGVIDNLTFALGIVHRMFYIKICKELSERLTSLKQKIFQFIFTEQTLVRGCMGGDLRQLILLFLFDEKEQAVKSIWKILFSSKNAVVYRYSLYAHANHIYLYWFLNPFFSIYRLIRGSMVNCWAGKGIGGK